MREYPSLPAGRGFAPVRVIDPRRDVSRRPCAAGGFTLLELVLVIGLMVLLASFAWPALRTRFERSQLPESGDQLRSLLVLTRAQAMLDNRRYRIRFAPNERQPIVEWEKDPFSAPGKYEPVKADWTAEDRLMGDVQVHEIRPGRPDYTLPLDDERSKEDQTEQGDFLEVSDQEAGALDSTEVNVPPPSDTTADAPIDEKRPLLVFEPDGSSDWATIILANVEPEKPLEESAEQIWIEIDGRTGLASIRPPLTEQEMADESLRIPRSKLRPPEVAFGKDLAITAVTQQQTGGDAGMTNVPGAGAGGFQTGGGTPQIPGGAASLDALSKLAGGQLPGGDSSQSGAKTPPDRKQGGGRPGQRPPGSGQDQPAPQDQQDNQTPTDHSQSDSNNTNDQPNQNNDNNTDTTTQPSDGQP